MYNQLQKAERHQKSNNMRDTTECLWRNSNERKLKLRRGIFWLTDSEEIWIRHVLETGFRNDVWRGRLALSNWRNDTGFKIFFVGARYYFTGTLLHYLCPASPAANQ